MRNVNVVDRQAQVETEEELALAPPPNQLKNDQQLLPFDSCACCVSAFNVMVSPLLLLLLLLDDDEVADPLGVGVE